MFNMQQIMQQAQAMQKKVMEKQEVMRGTDFVGEAGNGGVKITLNGVYEMKKIEIDDALLDDKEMLEDLIMVAYKNCKEEITKKLKNNFGELGVDPSLIGDML